MRTALAPLQLGLFAAGPPDLAPLHPRRSRAGPNSWVDHQPRLVRGADQLFDALLREVPWKQFRRPMYERLVDEPRLVAWYSRDEPLPHPLLSGLGAQLTHHYGVEFVLVGLNLYRHGRDSVAPHADRVGRNGGSTTVAIVSVGAPRPFQLRPAAGGIGRTWLLGGGDLLVMGGACQSECRHGVPKVAEAGPRISITYRCAGSDTEREPWPEVAGLPLGPC
jgi:alkylated DNA repair dioxygenase AlkB